MPCAFPTHSRYDGRKRSGLSGELQRKQRRLAVAHNATGCRGTVTSPGVRNAGRHLRSCSGISVHPLPNKRLKLAGGERSKGSGVLCPWAGQGLRLTPLRRRAGRPQLKRDPLGGALPPRDHPESTAVVWCVCGAPNAEPRRPLSARRAPPPHGRAIGVPRLARPSERRLPRIGFRVEAGRAPVGRAARSSLEERRAV